MNESRNVRQRLWARLPASLAARSDKARVLSKNWSYQLVAVVLFLFFSVCAMRMMVRRMRNLTQIKLREQYENKRLNQRHKRAQRHQQDRRKPGRRWRKS